MWAPKQKISIFRLCALRCCPVIGSNSRQPCSLVCNAYFWDFSPTNVSPVSLHMLCVLDQNALPSMLDAWHINNNELTVPDRTRPFQHRRCASGVIRDRCNRSDHLLYRWTTNFNVRGSDADPTRPNAVTCGLTLSGHEGNGHE